MGYVLDSVGVCLGQCGGMSRTVWGMSRTVGENVSDSVGVCLGQCGGNLELYRRPTLLLAFVTSKSMAAVSY